ncbi:hypothetical protein GGE42_001182 [Rhizobium leguminosarum]|nr:hypothetical protein [Rhizobium leguminosarum]MBB4471954.1 hypothetical protein [Rhizobium leguminosarum]
MGSRSLFKGVPFIQSILVYAGIGINAKELDIEGGAFGLMRN